MKNGQKIGDISNSTVIGTNVALSADESHPSTPRRWLVVLSVTNLILSASVMTALCLLYPRSSTTVDYLGIIVGILAALLTVLIAFNLYSLIDFRQHLRTLRDLSGDVQRLKDSYLSLSAQNEVDKSQLLFERRFFSCDNDLKFLSVSYAVNAVCKYAEHGDFYSCHRVIDSLNSHSDYVKKATPETIAQLKLVVRSIPEPHRIDNYSTLVSLVDGLNPTT